MQKACLVLAVIILIILVGGGYFLYHQKQNNAVQAVATSCLRPLGGFDRYKNLASQYAVDDTQAYYEGGAFDADPATLEIIRGSLKDMKGNITYKYARDLRKVYYEGFSISDVVPSTFRLIENGSGYQSYSTDGQTVYFYYYPVPGADPRTFKILWQTIYEGCPQTPYSKDATHVYFDSPISRSSRLVPGADPATFESLIRGFGKDKRGYYEGATYIGPTIDLSKLTCEYG